MTATMRPVVEKKVKREVERLRKRTPRLDEVKPPEAPFDSLREASEAATHIATMHNGSRVFIYYDPTLPRGRYYVRRAGEEFPPTCTVRYTCYRELL